jgi:putative flippase GtrA
MSFDGTSVPAPLTPLPNSFTRRFKNLFPAGQLVRYLCVGAFNTVFGYVTYVTMLTVLNGVMPPKYLSLTVVLASAIVTPFNITVAFLGYKFLVFRTKGNFLREWMKCFAVYGVGWIPSLIGLSAFTGILQGLFHRYSVPLHAALATVELHLSGAPLRWLQHVANGRAAAGYVAGAILVVFATVYSFMGHKHVTFKTKPLASETKPLADNIQPAADDTL